MEPVVGNVRVNKGTLRGQEEVNGQWQMYCLVHNIEKFKKQPALNQGISANLKYSTLFALNKLVYHSILPIVD
jgi:hypothetical protein